MPATNPPTDPAAQLKWMVDREAIRNLISDFGTRIDDKDQAAYAANFTEDAVLELPFGTMVGRAAIAAMKGPPQQWRTQHLIGNIVIDLDGDEAHTRAYLMATHVFSPDDLTKKAHAGGWYLHHVVRTDDGWRFAHAKLVEVWHDQRPMLPGGPQDLLPAAAHANS